MTRLVLALGAAAALLFACTFDTPPFEENGYLPCHADKSCDNPDCACLDGKVCVPRSDLGAALDPQKCQCPDGRIFCAGECADVTSDPRHCGSCDTDCLAQFSGTIGEAVCQNSQCGVACPPSSADCDNDWKNGCDPLGTFEHCADCTSCPLGQVCSRGQCAQSCANGETPCNGTCCSEQVHTSDAHGTATCIDDQCTMDCDPGYWDCDGVIGNGCETFLDDPANCRQTCRGPTVNCRITVQHVEAATCENGICGYTDCNSAFEDCDGDATNGCETPLRQAKSCGLNCQDIHDCTVEASNANGAFCNTGVCDYERCKFGFGDCNNKRQDGCETNLLANPEHCGQCNRSCEANNAETLVCVNGMCVIPSGACLDGFADCDGLYHNGCEANLNDDVLHCRTCDGDCVQQAPQHTFASCQFGDCIFECLPGWLNCDVTSADCETRMGTGSNCTQCHVSCSANQLCSAAGCTNFCSGVSCPDLSCANTSIDVFHCGDCTTDCHQLAPPHSLPKCINGVCDFSQCLPPYLTCADPAGNVAFCEVDPFSDPLHCGSCNNACAPGQPCTNGVCGEPGPVCGAVADNCLAGSVCCTALSGQRQCQSHIADCRFSGTILTCDGPEDCGLMERCFVVSLETFDITLCSVYAPGEIACSSNRDCPYSPTDPEACCPSPAIPNLNLCQPGCGTCGNFCKVGLCNVAYNVCGDYGRGICPSECNYLGAGKACCFSTENGTAPLCLASENCPDQPGMIQIECNDRLDCVMDNDPTRNVCCLHGFMQLKTAECVASNTVCEQNGGQVVCASDADCPELGGSRQVCRQLGQSGLFVCQ